MATYASVNLSIFLGNGVHTEAEGNKFKNFFRALYERANVKLLKYADQHSLPVPRATNNESVLWYIAQTISICAAAYPNIPDKTDDKVYCQAMYLVCVCACGGVLSDRQCEILIQWGKASDEVAHLFNTFFQDESIYEFGNLRQLQKIQHDINIRGEKVKTFGTIYDGKSDFAKKCSGCGASPSGGQPFCASCGKKF